MIDLVNVQVLLVESDDEDAGVFRHAMSRIRHHSVGVVHVRSVAEAEQALERDSFDVICVEMDAPGLEFLRKVRAQSTNPPVVILADSIDEEKAFETLRAGAAEYLVKDQVTPDALDRVLRTVRDKYVLERERERMMQRLSELSVRDDLTELANRRHLMAKLSDELLRSGRTGHFLALLMVDLDRFQDVNASRGHQIGDDVLKSCASTIVANLRSTDFVARYGEDAFCILLPETAPEDARRVAEKMRRVVDELPDPTPTASVGVAFWQPRVSREAILRQADQALHLAKEQGRNRVVVYDYAGEEAEEADQYARM
ncbi:MAG: diguanylate cyclase [Candidatus Methylomirabilota bacterium]